MRCAFAAAVTGLLLNAATPAQTVDRFDGPALVRHTAQSGAEVLRLMRNDKLDLVLPGAMRDNQVDMWIHVTRQGDPDPMAQQFGETYGYLVFTDRRDRIERAVFGSPGAVEKIDVRGSAAIARALSSYDAGYRIAEGYGDEVYDEFRKFVEERDPKSIAVNTSDWLAVADGMSHSAYQKLVKVLGPKYSARIVSAEKVITDFIVRRTGARSRRKSPRWRLHGRLRPKDWRESALARLRSVRSLRGPRKKHSSAVWANTGRGRRAACASTTRRNRSRLLSPTPAGGSCTATTYFSAATFSR